MSSFNTTRSSVGSTSSTASEGSHQEPPSLANFKSTLHQHNDTDDDGDTPSDPPRVSGNTLDSPQNTKSQPPPLLTSRPPSPPPASSQQDLSQSELLQQPQQQLESQSQQSSSQQPLQSQQLSSQPQLQPQSQPQLSQPQSQPQSQQPSQPPQSSQTSQTSILPPPNAQGPDDWPQFDQVATQVMVAFIKKCRHEVGFPQWCSSYYVAHPNSVPKSATGNVVEVLYGMCVKWCYETENNKNFFRSERILNTRPYSQIGAVTNINKPVKRTGKVVEPNVNKSSSSQNDNSNTNKDNSTATKPHTAVIPPPPVAVVKPPAVVVPADQSDKNEPISVPKATTTGRKIVPILKQTQPPSDTALDHTKFIKSSRRSTPNLDGSDGLGQNVALNAQNRRSLPGTTTIAPAQHSPASLQSSTEITPISATADSNSNSANGIGMDDDDDDFNRSLMLSDEIDDSYSYLYQPRSAAKQLSVNTKANKVLGKNEYVDQGDGYSDNYKLHQSKKSKKHSKHSKHLQSGHTDDPAATLQAHSHKHKYSRDDINEMGWDDSSQDSYSQSFPHHSSTLQRDFPTTTTTHTNQSHQSINKKASSLATNITDSSTTPTTDNNNNNNKNTHSLFSSHSHLLDSPPPPSILPRPYPPPSSLRKQIDLKHQQEANYHRQLREYEQMDSSLRPPADLFTSTSDQANQPRRAFLAPQTPMKSPHRPVPLPPHQPTHNKTPLKATGYQEELGMGHLQRGMTPQRVPQLPIGPDNKQSGGYKGQSGQNGQNGQRSNTHYRHPATPTAVRSNPHNAQAALSGGSGSGSHPLHPHSDTALSTGSYNLHTAGSTPRHAALVGAEVGRNGAGKQHDDQASLSSSRHNEQSSSSSSRHKDQSSMSSRHNVQQPLHPSSVNTYLGDNDKGSRAPQGILKVPSIPQSRSDQSGTTSGHGYGMWQSGSSYNNNNNNSQNNHNNNNQNNNNQNNNNQNNNNQNNNNQNNISNTSNPPKPPPTSNPVPHAEVSVDPTDSIDYWVNQLHYYKSALSTQSPLYPHPVPPASFQGHPASLETAYEYYDPQTGQTYPYLGPAQLSQFNIVQTGAPMSGVPQPPLHDPTLSDPYYRPPLPPSSPRPYQAPPGAQYTIQQPYEQEQLQQQQYQHFQPPTTSQQQQSSQPGYYFVPPVTPNPYGAQINPMSPASAAVRVGAGTTTNLNNPMNPHNNPNIIPSHLNPQVPGASLYPGSSLEMGQFHPNGIGQGGVIGPNYPAGLSSVNNLALNNATTGTYGTAAPVGAVVGTGGILPPDIQSDIQKRQIEKLIEFIKTFDESTSRLRSHLTAQCEKMGDDLDLTRIITGATITLTGKERERFSIRIATKDGSRRIRFYLTGLDIVLGDDNVDDDVIQGGFVPPQLEALPTELTIDTGASLPHKARNGSVDGTTITLPRLKAFRDDYDHKVDQGDGGNHNNKGKNDNNGSGKSSQSHFVAYPTQDPVYASARALIAALGSAPPSTQVLYTPGIAVGCELPLQYQQQRYIDCSSVTQLFILFSAIVHCQLSGDRILGAEDAINAYNQGQVDIQEGRGNVLLAAAYQRQQQRTSQLNQVAPQSSQQLNQPRSQMQRSVPVQPAHIYHTNVPNHTTYPNYDNLNNNYEIIQNIPNMHYNRHLDSSSPNNRSQYHHERRSNDQYEQMGPIAAITRPIDREFGVDPPQIHPLQPPQAPFSPYSRPDGYMDKKQFDHQYDGRAGGHVQARGSQYNINQGPYAPHQPPQLPHRYQNDDNHPQVPHQHQEPRYNFNEQQNYPYQQPTQHNQGYPGPLKRSYDQMAYQSHLSDHSGRGEGYLAPQGAEGVPPKRQQGGFTGPNVTATRRHTGKNQLNDDEDGYRVQSSSTSSEDDYSYRVSSRPQSRAIKRSRSNRNAPSAVQQSPRTNRNNPSVQQFSPPRSQRHTNQSRSMRRRDGDSEDDGDDEEDDEEEDDRNGKNGGRGNSPNNLNTFQRPSTRPQQSRQPPTGSLSPFVSLSDPFGLTKGQNGSLNRAQPFRKGSKSSNFDLGLTFPELTFG